jgi:hypothetical protein
MRRLLATRNGAVGVLGVLLALAVGVWRLVIAIDNLSSGSPKLTCPYNYVPVPNTDLCAPPGQSDTSTVFPGTTIPLPEEVKLPSYVPADRPSVSALTVRPAWVKGHLVTFSAIYDLTVNPDVMWQ